MILKRERLDYSQGYVPNNILMFTANSTIKANGKLVMCAGNARAVRDQYRGIDKIFGNEIKHHEVFGVKFESWGGVQWLGAFQTKIDWRNDSPLDVVECSVDMLTKVAVDRPQWTFHLPCPTVNRGGRSEDEILPMLTGLPDNVIVYLD